MQYTNLLSQWPIYVVLAAVVTLSSPTAYGQTISDTAIVSKMVADPGKFATGSEFPQQTEFIDSDSIPNGPASPVPEAAKPSILEKAVNGASSVTNTADDIANSELGITVRGTLVSGKVEEVVQGVETAKKIADGAKRLFKRFGAKIRQKAKADTVKTTVTTTEEQP